MYGTDERSEQIVNILVIGNGFDLAHKLPTKYSDFLNFIRGFLKYDLVLTQPDLPVDNKERQYFEYFEKLNSDKPNVYGEIKSLASGNLWIDYFLAVYESREKDGKDGWIDFENEISVIIQVLDEIRVRSSEQFNTGTEYAKMDTWHFKRLRPLLFTGEQYKNIAEYQISSYFIPNCKKRLLEALNSLIRCLEIYLADYVQNLPIKPLEDIAALDIDQVLSFNYTNTAERLYQARRDKTIDYDYIHGKADIESSVEKCNLVLGIDEYLSVPLQDNDNEFIEFKKFYQRIFKATGSHYIDWIEARRDNAKHMPKAKIAELNIYIYGHSLDVTDKDTLRKLILEDGTFTTVYYYNKQDLGKKISNLVKVIGESELIRRTDGRHATIVFKETKK